jgi:hypothetical protein
MSDRSVVCSTRCNLKDSGVIGVATTLLLCPRGVSQTPKRARNHTNRAFMSVAITHVFCNSCGRDFIFYEAFALSAVPASLPLELGITVPMAPIVVQEESTAAFGTASNFWRQ